MNLNFIFGYPIFEILRYIMNEDIILIKRCLTNILKNLIVMIVKIIDFEITRILHQITGSMPWG